MTQSVYKDLLEVMTKRGGPYAGLDIPEFYSLVEALFTPEEAAMNNVLLRKPAGAGDIAGRINRDVNEVTGILERMADKGLCTVFQGAGAPLYQGIPFMPGIFEFQFISGGETEHDKSIAELVHAYKKAHESAKGAEKISYPATRVIPVGFVNLIWPTLILSFGPPLNQFFGLNLLIKPNSHLLQDQPL